MPSKPRQRCRVAWLEPIDADESPTFFSPLHMKDIFVLDSLKTYSWVALAAVFWAALLVVLGVGRPALLAVVAVVHCVVSGLVVGAVRVSGRVWPAGEVKQDRIVGT